MTEVYNTDLLINKIIRHSAGCNSAGRENTLQTKQTVQNTFTVMQLMDCKARTEPNTISITNKKSYNTLPINK